MDFVKDYECLLYMTFLRKYSYKGQIFVLWYTYFPLKGQKVSKRGDLYPTNKRMSLENGSQTKNIT